jgi:hypothetical protein
MPEYTDIPGFKPSEKQVQDLANKEHRQAQETRQAAAARHAEAHKQSGPAERMAGKAELTPAQQEMKAKREAARTEDLKQADTKFSDKKYAELPKKDPSSPSR